jgi:hypothetical protein
VGSGSDHAIFSKIAIPIAAGRSAGILLAYETSGFDAAPRGSADSIHFETRWRPSGGFGVTWQPNKINGAAIVPARPTAPLAATSTDSAYPAARGPGRFSMPVERGS